jgi:hypothetical protein
VLGNLRYLRSGKTTQESYLWKVRTGVAAEQRRPRELAELQRAEERLKLSEEIREEDERVSELGTWGTSCSRAKEIRAFVAELETVWMSQGNDTSGEPQMDTSWNGSVNKRTGLTLQWGVRSRFWIKAVRSSDRVISIGKFLISGFMAR